MKAKLLFLFFVLTQVIAAQVFIESPLAPPFEDVQFSSIAFADVDGDDDQDIFLTGQNSAGDPISKLYTNDGGGNFTEKPGTPFESVQFSAIAFADVDGDDDQDVLITGYGSSGVQISKLYTNNGAGKFTEKAGTPFEGVQFSSIAFADVDGDDDQDVLLTGQNSAGVLISKLYTNNGAGKFTEKSGTPFEGVLYSSVAFTDVDGDDDQDVLITGQNSSVAPISKLYINDGVGNFTAKTGTTIEGVEESSIAFADVDGDDDQDLIISGYGSSGTFISKLYTNNGAGKFTEKPGTPFEGVYFSAVAFADVDGDDDQDVLITGQNSSGAPVSKLYTNDGAGNFTRKPDTPFEDVYSGSIAFADVDGDDDQDVIITGYGSSGALIAELYINTGTTSAAEDIYRENSLAFVSFPNPSTLPTLYLSYDSAEMTELTISVYNINGIRLSQQKEFAVTGQQTFSVDTMSLTKGNYLIALDNGKRRGIARFIVQ